MKTGFLMASALLAALPVAASAQAAGGPAPAVSGTDAAASPAAVEIAGKLFPDGIYRKMLGPQFTQMMSGMVDGMGQMQLAPFLKAAGLAEDRAAQVDKATFGEIMAIIDPAFNERTKRAINGMFAAMIPLFEKLEPGLRSGLASALDTRFTPAKLAELRAFFATPTGSEYASQQYLLFMDPSVMGKMQKAMPEILAQMPTIMQSTMDAMKDLPKPRQYKDLTAAERAKLCRLFGAVATASRCK